MADADAFRSLGLDRRAALWAVRRLPDDVPLPLFESTSAREQPDGEAEALPAMRRRDVLYGPYVRGEPLD